MRIAGGRGINQLFKTKNIDIFVNIYVYMYIYVCRGENLNLRKYALNKNTRISMVGPIRLVDYFFTAPRSLRPRAFTRFVTSIIIEIIIIINKNNNQ